jgi:hypothetical protein
VIVVVPFVIHLFRLVVENVVVISVNENPVQCHISHLPSI